MSDPQRSDSGDSQALDSSISSPTAMTPEVEKKIYSESDLYKYVLQLSERKNYYLEYIRKNTENIPQTTAGNVKRLNVMLNIIMQQVPMIAEAQSVDQFREMMAEPKPKIKRVECSCSGKSMNFNCVMFALKSIIYTRISSILRDIFQRKFTPIELSDIQNHWETQLQVSSFRLLVKLHMVIPLAKACTGTGFDISDNMKDPILDRPDIGSVLRATLAPYGNLSVQILDMIFDTILGKIRYTASEEEMLDLDFFNMYPNYRPKVMFQSVPCLRTSNNDRVIVLEKRQGIFSQDFYEPSAFNTMIECLSHCETSIFQYHFESLNVLLTSNERNAIKILNDKDWNKLIVVLFERCSFVVDDQKTVHEDFKSEWLRDANSELAVLDKKGFMIKISLISLIILNALNYETNISRVREYILGALNVMSKISSSDEKNLKNLVHSRSESSGSSKKKFLIMKPSSQDKNMKSPPESPAAEPKYMHINTDLSRILLYSIIRRLEMSSLRSLLEPCSLIWTNVFVLLDLVIDFIFHLDPENEVNDLGFPSIKVRKTDQFDTPDAILTMGVNNFLNKYLSKEVFKPEHALPEMRKDTENRMNRLQKVSRLFSNIDKFFKFVKTSQKLLSQTSKDRLNKARVTLPGNIGTAQSSTPRKDPLGKTLTPKDSSSSDSDDDMQMKTLQIASDIYKLRFIGSSDSLLNDFNKKSSKFQDVFGLERKRQAELFSKVLMDLALQNDVFCGEEDDGKILPKDLNVVSNTAAKSNDENLMILQKSNVGVLTIKKRENKYANYLAQAFVQEVYDNKIADEILEEEDEVIPEALSPTKESAKNMRIRRKSSAN